MHSIYRLVGLTSQFWQMKALLALFIPPCLHSKFTEHSYVSSYSLRDTSDKCAIHLPCRNFMKNSFNYSRTVLSNSLRLIYGKQTLLGPPWLATSNSFNDLPDIYVKQAHSLSTIFIVLVVIILNFMYRYSSFSIENRSEKWEMVQRNLGERRVASSRGG